MVHAADECAVQTVHQLGSNVSAALHGLLEHACARNCQKSFSSNTGIDKQMFGSFAALGHITGSSSVTLMYECCRRYVESMYKMGRVAYVKLLQSIGGLAQQKESHDSSEL